MSTKLNWGRMFPMPPRQSESFEPWHHGSFKTDWCLVGKVPEKKGHFQSPGFFCLPIFFWTFQQRSWCVDFSCWDFSRCLNQTIILCASFFCTKSSKQEQTQWTNAISESSVQTHPPRQAKPKRLIFGGSKKLFVFRGIVWEVNQTTIICQLKSGTLRSHVVFQVYEYGLLRWIKRCLVLWVVVSKIFYFQPYLGKWSNLTNIVRMGWNHQLVLYVFLGGSSHTEAQEVFLEA